MDNYIEYKLSKVNARLKPDIVPHLFACQPDKQKSSKRLRETSEKRLRKKMVTELMHKECLEERIDVVEDMPVLLKEKDKDGQPLVFSSRSNFVGKREATCQTKIVHFRSKAIQVDIKPKKEDAATTPLKLRVPDVKVMDKIVKKHLDFDDNTKSVEPKRIGTLVETSDSDLYRPTESTSSESNTSTSKQEFGKMFINIIESKLRMYTGIPQSYLELVQILERTTGLKQQHIYIVLYKIKTNESFAKIGDLFGLSKASAARIFSQTVVTVAEYMKKLIFWPNENSIQGNLPIQFRMLFSGVQSIIDCLEIEIQKPSSALHQSLTWSDYKKCNTVKYLISATPDGLINFISCGYGGRASDVAILENCGYLDMLPENSVVMADRGFKQIESLLCKKNCTLVRPPSVTGDSKMTEDEVILTKRIASVRIHIERIIKRIRDFKLLSPHATVNSELVKKIDSAIVVACAIINLQKPIINQ